MRIAIDARFYGTEHSGLGRYTINFLNQLKKLDDQNSYYLLLKNKYLDLSFPKNFHFVECNILHYTFREQLLLPSILAKIKPDLFHSLHLNVPVFTRTPFLVTIHDLIKSHFKSKDTTTRPTPIFRLKRLGYNYAIQKAIKNSLAISVPSNFVKKDILENFPEINPEKIHVIKEAPDPIFLQDLSKKQAKEILTQASIHPDLTKLNYLLYVGNAYPHKNLSRLISAYSNLNQEDLKLVLLSKKNQFLTKTLSRFPQNLTQNIITLENISDQALHALYKLAKLTITPSLMEGFGLVGLESLASETPVVASDIPVYREVYGDSVFYADPRNTQSLTQAIQETLTSNKKPKLPKNYSWQKLTQKTLGLYHEISTRL